MISLILYGRNDAHGYNLHRRVALSLNCLAEVLTDPDDEIVFVDYNTPDELPTFVEAISDTLTSRCLDRVRVLRVRASVHHERYSSRTHLPVVEPVARNAAVRRSNPANRWLLSTNTDIVIVPPAGESLSDVCRDLPDAFYGLPRFELPEWLWETLPRANPEESVLELRRLGPRLRLDEHTLSYEWIRFDAPGDFQLCLRDDFFAIDGFDEEMLLGWHVDSNLAKRLALRRGSIETVGRLASYHCNHSRTPTVYHELSGVENDFDRFFFDLKDSPLPSQRESWGLADDPIEEISMVRHAGVALAKSLIAAIPAPEAQAVATTAEDWAFGLTYDSGHVLPFVADSIAVSPPGATILYLGANPSLQRMLEVLASELDRGLTVDVACDRLAAGERAASADLVVVDLGLDSTDVGAQDLSPGAYPPGLRSVLGALRDVVAEERSRLESGEHPRRFVLVNSTTLFTHAYVTAQFDYSFSTMHSRVRRATVKLAPLDDETIAQGLAEATRRLRWSERSETAREPLQLRVGTALVLAELEDFRGFGVGWATPEATGIWTSGERAEVCFSADTTAGTHLLSLSIGRVGAGRDESLEVDMLIDGSRVDTQRLPGGPAPFTWRVALPAGAHSAGLFELTLEIHPPRTWQQDDRKLGLHVHAFELQRDDWRRRLVDAISGLRRPRS